MNIYIKSHICKSSLVLLFLLSLSFIPAQIHAEDTNRIDSLLRISPVLLKISLEPGSKQIHTITVENRTDNPMPIRASVEGFDPSDEDSGYSPKPSTEVSPLSSWITLNKSEAIIPAKSTETYAVKINVPSTVPIGGYYAIIYFSPVYPGVSVTSKIGVIALANIGVQDSIHQKAEIAQFSFSTPLYEKNPLTVNFRVTNTALHYFSAKPQLTISPLWGKSDSVDLDEKILLPGKSRSWKSVFSIQNSKWGIYKASLRVSIGNGMNISKTTIVAILPIRLTIGVLLSISLLVFIWKKRKNISAALFVLLKGDAPKEQISTTQDAIQNPPAPQSSRDIDPQRIIETVKLYHGSVSKAAKTLGIDRTTVYRWVAKAKNSKAKTLQRKSTKPHTLRKITLDAATIENILELKRSRNISAKDIVKELRLSISARTVFRILQSHKLTREYTR